MEKTDSELDHGVCPFHPNGTVEEINEENYFFRFSKFQKPLLDFYKNNPDFVKPKHRFNEIIKFIEGGLNDFSISRLKEKMPWGVPIPGDDDQVMYVWFDALVNYISCLGWPDNLKNFNDFWPATQVCGKDNLRPQTAMWPSLLLSAGLQLPKEVLVFGFLTLNGKKMSKSSNNIIDLTELINKYGSDSVRYYLAKEISTFEDGDFSYEKLEKLYTSDLVNGLGNLVSRVSNLIEKNDIKVNLPKIVFSNNTPLLKKISNEYDKFLTVMSEYKLNEALEIINSKIKKTDEFLSEKAPWKMSDKKEINEVLQKAAENILEISILIWPIIPQAANGIILQFTAEKIIKKEILFPKLLNN